MPDPQAHMVRPVKMNAICSNLDLFIIIWLKFLLNNYYARYHIEINTVKNNILYLVI